MNTEKYIAIVEGLIADQQQIQMTNPPTSQRWIDASAEIHRLADLIVQARSCSTCAYITANGGFGPSHEGNKECQSGSLLPAAGRIATAPVTRAFDRGQNEFPNKPTSSAQHG